MLKNVKINRAACAAAASDPALLATDHADYLVKKRNAHFARRITSSVQSWRWRKKSASC